MKKIIITLCMCAISLPLMGIGFPLPDDTKKEIQFKKDALKQAVSLAYQIAELEKAKYDFKKCQE